VKGTARRRLGRFVPRGGGMLLALLAVIVYHKSIPSWVWTLVVGILVVAVVYYLLAGARRGRR
jgi:O-antigen/teichoic acid export membrane protein